MDYIGHHLVSTSIIVRIASVALDVKINTDIEIQWWRENRETYFYVHSKMLN